MASEQVVNKILSDAQAQAEEIAAAAGRKESSERAELQQRLDEYESQTGKLAAEARQKVIDRILSGARMEQAAELLALKVKILDEVFEEAARFICGLDKSKYRGFIGVLMADAVETGDENVVVGKDETRIDQQFIDQVAAGLEKPGKKGLKLSSKRRDIQAGFILERGRIRKDLSLRVLLSQVRRELEAELARELFSREAPDD
jgi:V/A-type H+-transporting ATPase subunit E